MRFRLTAPLRQFMLTMLLAVLAVLVVPVAGATEAEVTSAKLESTEEGYRISASFSFELSRGLVDAIAKEIPLSFTTEVELTRPRWYWFDEKSILVQKQARLSYQSLTKQYRISSEGFTFSAPTITEALQVIGSIGGWRVLDNTQIDPSKAYTAGLKMSLDLSKLPKPFQVNALNNRDWNVSSEWLHFPFNPAGQNLIQR